MKKTKSKFVSTKQGLRNLDEAMRRARAAYRPPPLTPDEEQRELDLLDAETLDRFVAQGE